MQEIQANEDAGRREEEAARKPVPPPIPYRVNTSGLSTSNLPKPPIRHIDQGDQSPTHNQRPSTKPKPSLPPRLPPRHGSVPSQKSTSPPPPYSATPDAASRQEATMDQAAMSRLGSAGISVPGLGIGNNSPSAHQNTRTMSTQADDQGPTANGPQLNELQSRFSKLSANSQSADPSSQGTSLAEKQAAMQTAQSFRNDPSSVSLADARNTAATANNFRERHGDQVNAGWKSANAMNKKYDIANRANSFATQTSPPPGNAASTTSKKPPPPPPQKPGFSGEAATSPPPVPLSSKPR